MNVERFTIAEARDHYFVGSIDGLQNMFVMHPDRSICIALASQPISLVESAETVLAELQGLAA